MVITLIWANEQQESKKKTAKDVTFAFW